MSIGEVFQQQVPSLAFRIPMRLETARRRWRCDGAGNLLIECHLLPTGILAAAGTFGKTRLQDDCGRSVL